MDILYKEIQITNMKNAWSDLENVIKKNSETSRYNCENVID